MRESCTVRKPELVWRSAPPSSAWRTVADEQPVALTYNGSTYAVMMASPIDLLDFGVGFSLNEGILEHPRDIVSIEALELGLGFEVRMWLDGVPADRLASRRRARAGVVGCGLCGIESLEQACPAPPAVISEMRVPARTVLQAMQALRPLQHHNAATGALHAAAFWDPSGVRFVREDVGRHNALDKVAGALARSGLPSSGGAVLLTSRVSVDLVQKVAMMGVPLLVAVSAPTSLAIETAEQAGITLVAVARDDGYEVFSRADRLIFTCDDQELAESGRLNAAAL
jgi:FdhD protein